MNTRALSISLTVLALAACGTPPTETPDAGVDTSCGLDCESQERYGLILKRCFEYSTSNTAETPPALGARVADQVRELEGGLKVIPVTYYQGGQQMMEDLFTIKDGALVLVRRSFLKNGGSVTYKDTSGALTGVTWLGSDTGVGETIETQIVADVVSTTQESQDTNYRIVTAAASTLEQTVPQGNFPDALKLIFTETPAHGSDGRRLFVAGTGFTIFTTSFTLGMTGGPEYRLQGIRDIGSAEGGTHECSLAVP